MRDPTLVDLEYRLADMIKNYFGQRQGFAMTDEAIEIIRAMHRKGASVNAIVQRMKMPRDKVISVVNLYCDDQANSTVMP